MDEGTQKIEESDGPVLLDMGIVMTIFDSTNRRAIRAAFGLPDDGKEWCVACQKAHKPPVHEVTQ